MDSLPPNLEFKTGSQSPISIPLKPASLGEKIRAFFARLSMKPKVSEPVVSICVIAEDLDTPDDAGNYKIQLALLSSEPIAALIELKANNYKIPNEKNEKGEYPSDILLSDKIGTSIFEEAFHLYVSMDGAFPRDSDEYALVGTIFEDRLNPTIKRLHAEYCAETKLLEEANETLRPGEKPLTREDIRAAVLPLDPVTTKLQETASSGKHVDPVLTAAFGGLVRQNPGFYPGKPTV
jgi:hypothetical protein